MPQPSTIKLAAILILSGTLSYTVTQAATLDEAREQFRAGEFSRALTETNAFLDSNPKNIPALFLKAQIQSENKDVDDAIETYKSLIVEEPGHLQAYNNVAALYAQQGELKRASEILEQAIRTDPVFTTIHKNLRAIYIDMSQKHYRQALKLKADNGSTQIASIDIENSADQMLSEDIEVVPQSIQAAINTTVVSAKIASGNSGTTTPPTESVKKPDTVQSTSPEPKADSNTEKPKGSAMIEVDKKPDNTVPADQASNRITTAASSKKAVPEAEPEPESSGDTEPTPATETGSESASAANPEREVKLALLAWANAWSNRDVKKYIDAYKADYASAGKTNKTWVAERRWNFDHKKYIKVTLSEIQIKADGDQYTVSFKQNYQSDNYQDVVNKKLRFERQNNSWKITDEAAG